MSDLRIDVSTEEAVAELNAVVASPAFVRSPRLSRLLTYLCTKYLAGEADQIKEYNIGIEVLERPPSFDPTNDAGTRVEIHRLRRRLQKFYETEGAEHRLRIVIPVGHYVPAFVPNARADAPHPPIVEEAVNGNTSEVPYNLVADIIAREPRAGGQKPKILWVAAGLILFAAVAVPLVTRNTARSGNAAVRAVPVATAPATARSAVVVAIPLGNAVRLACGHSVQYTDRSGQIWGADRYFEGGTMFGTPRQYISRAFDPKLFQSGRTGEFSYRIPLTRGVYELRLGFAETAYGPGTPAGGGEYSRTFDVLANGRLLLDDFDIYSDANGTNVADTRVFKDISPASDGFLHLEFRGRRAPALVNNIELVPARPHRLNPIRFVAQENFVTGANGTVWSPDTFVSGGQLTLHSVEVTGAEEPDIFTRERYGHFEYAIPVDAGTYGVTLYMAEEYFGPGNPGGNGAGSRVFDVFCNGVALLHGFDIFKEGGMNHAVAKSFHGLTPNAQGKLVLTFVPVRNYASLYALEVLDESQ